MSERRLLSTSELENSPVVANCCMNRERDLCGSNGYEVELGFDPLMWLQERASEKRPVRWLDVCCGSGKALIQAANLIDESGINSISITGVDLVGMFLRHRSRYLKLVQCSVFEFAPSERFDLITCVHGLHYIGDKLRAIELAADWLTSGGLFVANLDLSNLCIAEVGKGHRKILSSLRSEGFQYLQAKHLLKCVGRKELKSSYRYVGADVAAGPNYTKQPAVNSYYEE